MSEPEREIKVEFTEGRCVVHCWHVFEYSDEPTTQHATYGCCWCLANEERTGTGVVHGPLGPWGRAEVENA